MLDDFTAENGATAVRPGTQVKSEYPWDAEDFHRHKVQAEGKVDISDAAPTLIKEIRSSSSQARPAT